MPTSGDLLEQSDHLMILPPIAQPRHHHGKEYGTLAEHPPRTGHSWCATSSPCALSV